MRRSLVPSVFVLGACLALSAPFMAQATCFSRNLSIGMDGEDVRSLQRILNTSADTRVTDVGTGSPGAESTYFGAKTKAAAIRFQEKYRSEVLTPAGLINGTGYIGQGTRKKLETLCGGGATPTVDTTTVASSSPATTSARVYLMYPSEYSGPKGKRIMVYGSGFTLKSPNTVYFGSRAATSVPQSPALLFVDVPNVSPGRYPLHVENANGKSNEDFFIVRDPLVPEPTLVSLDPSTGPQGTTVRITGTGFLPEGNELRTGITLAKTPSIDGKTIEWKIPNVFLGGAGTGTLPVWIYVVNDRGVSNHLVFDLKI